MADPEVPPAPVVRAAVGSVPAPAVGPAVGTQVAPVAVPVVAREVAPAVRVVPEGEVARVSAAAVPTNGGPVGVAAISKSSSRPS